MLLLAYDSAIIYTLGAFRLSSNGLEVFIGSELSLRWLAHFTR